MWHEHDRENAEPILKVHSKTLELTRVKVVATGTMGGGSLCTDAAGRISLRQVDLRGWDVTPNPEDKKAKKLKTNVCVQLDKGGELACSGIIAPSDRYALLSAASGLRAYASG